MSHTRLFLIRHAEVEAKYHRTFGGRIDMNLSDLGHKQAHALSRYLSRQTLDAVYASPMQRVQQTLAPLTVNNQPQVHVNPDLREVDFGDWTGLIWEEVETQFGVSPYGWLTELHHARMPNAETGAQLCKRVGGVLDEIIVEHPGQTIAIFCHGGVIRAALSVLLEMPLVKTAAFDVGYASVTDVQISSRGAEIKLLNFAPWQHE